MSSWLINTDKTINKWCKQMGLYCPMATTNGYCQITACINMAKPMPICNNKNATMPYETPKVNWNVDGYIPIEWIKDYVGSGVSDDIFQRNRRFVLNMIEDWEKENG